MISTAFIFILVLLVLVLAHELGHFLTARWLGVTVQEFGFGFPPRIFSVKRAGTTYSINWLPLGGFVKLKGEQGEPKNEPDSFASQKPWRRTIILVGGVTMNVILCFVLLTGGLMVGLPTILTKEQIAGARDVKIQIIDVIPNTPAAQAGIKIGDEVSQLDGRSFAVLPDMQDYIAASSGREIAITLRRGAEIINTKGVPRVLPESSPRAVLGVNLVQTGIVAYPWYEAIWRGAAATYNLTIEIGRGLGQLLSRLIFRAQVPADIAGPVGIAVLTGQVADLGWIYVLQFAALLSINLALINLLPFPALDGGRLLFVIIEKIRRKPADARIEALVHNIGFMFLMLLIVMITYRDILKFGGGWLKSLGGFF